MKNGREPRPHVDRVAVRGRYVPALAFRSLTPFYDTVLRRLFDEVGLKRRLIELAGVRPGERVIDVGCGTGTLLRQLAEAEPLCQPFGVDGDLAMLARALPKLAPRRGLVAAFAQQLPFRPAAFDRALSSLFLHHLPSSAKGPCLRAIHDLLREGGTLHVLDFDRPATFARRALFSLLRLFDGFDNTRDSARGQLPARLSDAGFRDVVELERVNTAVGTLAYWRAVRLSATPAQGVVASRTSADSVARRETREVRQPTRPRACSHSDSPECVRVRESLPPQE